MASQVAIMPEVQSLVKRIVAEEGMEAFAMPKRTAAVHEAGHCIVFAAQGERVRSCRIKSRRYAGKLYWGGLTFGGDHWSCGPNSDVESDLKRMRVILAGVCAELLFDRENYKSGSSLDEVVMAQGIAAIAAAKMKGVSAKDLYFAQFGATRAILYQHETALLALADLLERREWVHRSQMSALLDPVRAEY
jgi:hypothetical protein